MLEQIHQLKGLDILGFFQSQIICVASLSFKTFRATLGHFSEIHKFNIEKHETYVNMSITHHFRVFTNLLPDLTHTSLVIFNVQSYLDFESSTVKITVKNAVNM